jgi:hypothetical protein
VPLIVQSFVIPSAAGATATAESRNLLSAVSLRRPTSAWSTDGKGTASAVPPKPQNSPRFGACGALFNAPKKAFDPR